MMHNIKSAVWTRLQSFVSTPTGSLHSDDRTPVRARETICSALQQTQQKASQRTYAFHRLVHQHQSSCSFINGRFASTTSTRANSTRQLSRRRRSLVVVNYMVPTVRGSGKLRRCGNVKVPKCKSLQKCKKN